MSATSAPTPGLLFRWDPPRRRWRALAWFITLSTVAHLFAFYLFRISYPPAVTLLPPPVSLQVISDATPEGRALLQWVEAEDPALVSTTMRPPGQKATAFPEIPYVPSYMTHEPQLRMPPPLEPQAKVTTAMPPGPVPLRRDRPRTDNTSVPTTVVFGAELKHPDAQLASRKFTTTMPDAPANATFHVAVSTDGVVRYLFVDESSGDTGLDQQAQQHLREMRFPGRTTSDLLWTTATFVWGNDISARAPKSVQER